MDRFPDKIDSKFRFVLVAANRAEQLMKGAPAKVEPRGRKATIVALDELKRDLVDWEMGDPPSAEPAVAEAAEVAEEAEELPEPSDVN
jgi:DNA-directed RNA polymerase omega subunit